MVDKTAALMDVGPAGAGEFSVNLQCGFMGPEAQGGLVLLALGKADRELLIQAAVIIRSEERRVGKECM